MKFEMNRANPKQKIIVPNTAGKLSGLDTETRLELCVLNGAIVITKAKLTAMDAVNLYESFSGMAVELMVALGNACGTCNNCGCCEYLCDTQSTRLPEHILEVAGLPHDCKLAAEGSITVCPAGHDYDLSDVSPDTLALFEKSGICIRELEELLMGGGIICSGDDDGDNDDEDGDADDF